MIKLGKEKKIFWLVIISFFLLPFVFGAQVNTSDVILAEKNYSTAQEATDATNSGNIEADQTVTRSFQGNISGIIQEGQHQILQLSSVSNSSPFSRHMMCKDYDHDSYDPIEPTTIFRPTDTKAVCLTTVSIQSKIEFRWYYRNDSSKTWVYTGYSPSAYVKSPDEYHFQCDLLIAGMGLYYPRAYKVDVYLDDSFSFSEFFEITNGGLNSPRICENVLDGQPVNMKSRFTRGNDTKAHHYLRFDKIAYFNDKYCHNFTTVWIQPNGSTYQTYSGNFTDYKNTDVTWNYWEYNYTQDDYISINQSTPVGNWKVEVYLDSYFNNTWMPYGPIATTPFIVGNETVADWTFMVYLDADNTLENASIKIFEKMASVNSSSHVNIVVQMDRILGEDSSHGNWTDCKRFNVTKDLTPTPENSIDELGEVNMGDPSTLKDFVNWTINNYPANYYCLVLWNHGAGCMGLCFDITNKTDPLSLPELSQALSGLPAIMDVVLLDACSMSMTEIAYQIKDYANVLVGPEGLGYAMVDTRAVPYDDYLSSLTNNSSMLPSAFATEVVTDYIDWCNSEVGIQNATMSATDLTKITSLTATIDDFAIKLKEKETFYSNLINSARNLTEGYQGPFGNQTGYYIDLYHFAQLINKSVPDDEELQNTAHQVMTTLESVIIIAANKTRPDSHGLSIFFPDEEDKYFHKDFDFDTLYENTTFAIDTRWDEFVKYHLLHQHQYYITVNSARGNPTPSQWVDEGHNLTVTVASPNDTIPNQTQWSCTGYRIDNGSLQEGTSYSFENVQTPHKIEFYWVQQFWLQFNQTGVDSYFLGTVVTIDGDNYSVSALPVSFWWDNDTTLSFAFQSPLVVTPYAEQYVWNSTNGLSSLQSDSITVSMSGNITGNYKMQYHLTMIKIFGTVTPDSGWHDAGSTVQISTSAPHAVDGERYVWLGWAGTGDGNYTGTSETATITMNSSITETASWRHEYRLIMDTNFGTTSPSVGEHWYEAGSTVDISATPPSATSGEQYVWLGWTGTGSGSYSSTDNPALITMNEPITKTAAWRHEYYLTVTCLYGSPTLESGWFEAGGSINTSVTSPVSGPTGTRYVCTGWAGTGSVPASGTAATVTFTINAPSSITWNWKTQYLLTVYVDPAGLGPQPNVSPPGPWYDNGMRVTCTAQKISGRVFDHWTVDGASWDPGKKEITINMDGPHEAGAHYERAPTWWEILLSVDMVNIYIGILGFVALPFALVGIEWYKNRRRRGTLKALLNEIDEVYSSFKTNPPRCEEELYRLRDKNLEVVADGKITQESYDIMDRRIEKYLEELGKQK